MIRFYRALLLLLPIVAAADVVVPVDSVEFHVNIRMTPDAKSEIVGRLPQGEWRTVVESIEGWHEVEIAGGATGFISSDWTVRLPVAPEPSNEDSVAETADEAPVEVADKDLQEESTAIADIKTELSDVTAANANENPVPGDVENALDTATSTGHTPEVDTSETAEPGKIVIARAENNTVDAPPAESAAVERVADASADEVDTVALLSDDVQADATLSVGGQDAPESVGAASLPPGPTGPVGPQGPEGPPGPAGGANIEGNVDYLMKFTAPTIGGNSQVYDDGNHIGIGTTAPKQRLEVNGNIQIHEQNSSVAGLMITQSSGETGYIMHNRASTLTIGAGSVDRITIDREGNVGLGTARPAYPLELANGAYVTDGGVWTNASSRELKENIQALDSAEALAALAGLEPMRFNYKGDPGDDYVGFIAEDVPALVASGDRKGLAAMDIVAVLTRVVQDQQKKIEELEAKLDQR